MDGTAKTDSYILDGRAKIYADSIIFIWDFIYNTALLLLSKLIL